MMCNFFARFPSTTTTTVLALLLSAVPAAAQTPPSGDAPTSETQESTGTSRESLPLQEVTVGLYISRPFVMEGERGGYTGLAVDLWEGIADTLNLQTNYVVVPTIRALIDSTEAGVFDVAVTNLTINKNRLNRIDFTHSWYDAGLQIMTAEGHAAGFRGIIEGLRDSGYLRTYGLIALAVLLATLLITFFYRRFDPEFPKQWKDSIAEGFYTVMSLMTSGKTGRQNLFGWIGRIWQGAWLVCGVALLAYVTSTVTSVMTTISLTGHITSVDDLSGRTVAVRDGSDAEEVIRGMGLRAQAFQNTDEIAEALLDGSVDAMVGDSPVLKYYVYTHPGLPLQVVGGVFKKDKYGFGLPRGSELTRPLSVELVGARRSGRIAELRTEYFGDEI